MPYKKHPRPSRKATPAPGQRQLPGGERAYLDAILESTVEGIVVIDQHGLIQTFNRAAQEMFGYTTGEVEGKNISMLMPEPFRSGHDGYMEHYLRTGKAKIIGIGREAVGLHKDGSTFPIELAVSEVVVAGQRTFTGLVKDITQRKALEKEILEVSEREQRRIGRELHDGVCQELAGIAFQVQALQQKAAGQGTIAPAELAEVVSLLQGAMRRARGLSHGLYPVDPGPNGLCVALDQLAKNTSDAGRVDCTFAHEGNVEAVSPAVATHLYRIAQEAVRDAAGRGHARNIAIELFAANRAVTLTVRDNGIDLKTDGRLRSDMVLQLMQHRAHVIGASLHVSDGKRGGVSVVCTLMLPANTN